MVILGRELKPGAGRWQGGGEEAGAAAARLAGAALAAAAVPGLQGCIPWYNAVLGLQLVSLGDSALLATDLQPGSFRLELLAGPGGEPGGAAGASGGAPAAAGFGHFSLVVPSTGAVLEALRAAGRGDLILEECAAVTPVRAHGHSYTDTTSRIRDPSGFNWQLMEMHRGQVRERLCSVMIRVRDLRSALKWYTGVLGMKVHQQYEAQETGYSSALVGYGPELQCTLLELRQEGPPPAAAAVAAGAPRLCRFLLAVPDLAATAERLKAQGQPFEALQLPSSEHASGAVPALAVADADGWRFCFVEAAGEGEAAAMEP